MLKLATKFAPSVTSFELADEAGYRYAEFYLNSHWLSRSQEIQSRVGGFCFEYVSHFPNEHDLREDVVQAFVDLTRTVGDEVVVIHTDVWDRYRTQLTNIAPDLVFAIENHYCPPDELQTWIEQSDAVTLDVEHLWKFSLGDVAYDELLATLEWVIREAGDKLRHVHLPGYLPGQEEHRPMYCSRDLVLATLDMLEQYNYDGFVVSESDTVHQNLQELMMDRVLFDLWQSLRSGEDAVAESQNA